MSKHVLKAFANDTLAAQLLVGGTSATLTTGNFGTITGEQLLVIDPNNSKREIIKCTIAGTALTSITRGVDGTSAVQHEIGAIVRMAWVPSHLINIQDNGVSQFWATLSSSGYDRTTQATTALANNSAYTVTKIVGNPAGTSDTSGVTKILGGFYFAAPRTGSYEIKVDASIRLGGATGPYGGWIYITQDTTNPTQNADGVSDTGTAIKAIVTTISGGAYLDTSCLSGTITVSLTAGTTYYFTMQTKWQSTAGTTPDVVSVGDQGQISTMTIKELSNV